MDMLCIDQLIVMAKIGIHGWERHCLQKIVFDLKLIYDNTYFIKGINVSDYLDYSQINQTIITIVNTKHFLLIEDIAEIVSKKLIERFSVIYQVQIKVNKPGAIGNARNVGIYIKRNKSDYSEKMNLYVGWK